MDDPLSADRLLWADLSVFNAARTPDLDLALCEPAVEDVVARAASLALFSTLRDRANAELDLLDDEDLAEDGGVNADIQSDSAALRCLAAQRNANVRLVRVEIVGAERSPECRRREGVAPALHVESASLPASDMLSSVVCCQFDLPT